MRIRLIVAGLGVKLLLLKTFFKSKMEMQSFASEKYIVKKGYLFFMESIQEEDVKWSKIVWERFSIPKHRFVMWLLMQGRLRKK